MEHFQDQQNSAHEHTHAPSVEVEPGFAGFVPQEFLDNPAGYFEREGKNIKSGEIKYDETGLVREDPTAVKDLPVWKNDEGVEIQTVGKRVNPAKGTVGESGDPFHEYKILEQLAEMGLPAAKPIAKVEQGDTHIIVMERIPGLRWSEKDSLNLKENGYSDERINALMIEAEQKMNELKALFDEAGVVRSWKLKDMVFQVDLKNGKIDSMVPTDWERTEIIEQFEPSQDQERNVEHDKSTFLEAVKNTEIVEIETDFDENSSQTFQLALAEAKVLLLGETHGVMENPDIIYTLFKKFGFRNLALEWKPPLKEQVDRFLNGEELDFEPMKNSPDGRITAGHFALLKKLKEEGLLEKVTCFDQGGSSSWDMRDENMARNIINELTDTPTLVVAGNLHTETEPITFEDEEGEHYPEHYPMGERVKRSIPHVPSGRIKYLAGTFQNHGTKSFGEKNSGAAPRMARFYKNEEGLYIFELPEAHAAVVPNPSEVF